jgi:hypothetical protein
MCSGRDSREKSTYWPDLKLAVNSYRPLHDGVHVEDSRLRIVDEWRAEH